MLLDKVLDRDCLASFEIGTLQSKCIPVPVEAMSASADGPAIGPDIGAAYPIASSPAVCIASTSTHSVAVLVGLTAAPAAVPQEPLTFRLLLLVLPPAAALSPRLLLCALLPPLLRVDAGPSSCPDDVRLAAAAAAVADPGLNGVTGAANVTVSVTPGAVLPSTLLTAAAAGPFASASAVVAAAAALMTAGVAGNSQEVSQTSLSLTVPLSPLLAETAG